MAKERKTNFVRFRVTQTEARQIKAASKERGMTVSKFIRLAIEKFINCEVEHVKAN